MLTHTRARRVFVCAADIESVIGIDLVEDVVDTAAREIELGAKSAQTSAANHDFFVGLPCRAISTRIRRARLRSSRHRTEQNAEP